MVDCNTSIVGLVFLLSIEDGEGGGGDGEPREMVLSALSDSNLHGYLCPTAGIDPGDVWLGNAERLAKVHDTVRLIGSDAVRGEGGVGRV